MNKKIKKLWVDALKSGEYNQGEGHLCDNDNDGNITHCCLGVLCDLHAKTMKKKSFNESGKYLKVYSLLPKAVTKWAKFTENELDDHEDEYDVNVRNTTLSGLNDHGKTFEQIAEQIEKYL